jgi:prepilin peptidase CpaA
MIGAGDVKLVAAVGAFTGPVGIFGVVLMTFIAGGVLALGSTFWTRSFGRVGRNLRTLAIGVSAAMVERRSVADAVAEVPSTGRMPYAVAIACGTALQLIAASDPRWMFA